MRAFDNDKKYEDQCRNPWDKEQLHKNVPYSQ